MDIKEKIKALEGRFGIYKLHAIGGSHALIVPKFWAMLNCIEIEGEYYVKVTQIDGDLVFSAIDTDEIEKLKVRRK